MKALSIKQPWAWLICAGYKDIENRGWFIGRKVASGAVDFRLVLPQKIYVHAGKTRDYTDGINDFLHLIFDGDIPHQVHELGPEQFGAIIGEVDIIACVTESKSPWFVGKYGFVLANPKLYDKPIICRGQLGFFTPEFEVGEKVIV